MLFQMDFFPTMKLLYSVYFKTIFIFFHFSSMLSSDHFFVFFLFFLCPPKYFYPIISPLLSNNSISTRKIFFPFLLIRQIWYLFIHLFTHLYIFSFIYLFIYTLYFFLSSTNRYSPHLSIVLFSTNIIKKTNRDIWEIKRSSGR